MSIRKKKLVHWKMDGVALVDGEKVADGILLATEV